MINLIKNKTVDCAALTEHLEYCFRHYDIKSEEEIEIFADKIEKFMIKNVPTDIENPYEVIQCVDDFTYKKTLENSIC